MNQFIKLPDDFGTIINVAHVQQVWADNTCPNTVFIITESGGGDYPDPDGKIYAWFAERAVEVK